MNDLLTFGCVCFHVRYYGGELNLVLTVFALFLMYVMIGPYIHSTNDDISHINFDHMKQFAKLALGFAVELGHYKGEKN